MAQRPAPYANPTVARRRRAAKFKAMGLTPADMKAEETRRARAYALNQLQMLSQAGLGDLSEQAGMVGRPGPGRAANDPAAMWRAASSALMGQFNESGAGGDPRAWLQERIQAERRRKRAAALAAAMEQGGMSPYGTMIPE